MTSHPDPSLPEDKTLWEILPTTFTDADGNQWMFRKLTVRDVDTLKQKGISLDKILLEMDLLDIMRLSHQWLEPVSPTPEQTTPDLDTFLDLLSEDVLSDAHDAFRRCVTNFFPRSQRIGVRQMIRMEPETISLLAQKRMQDFLNVVRQQVTTDSPSPSPVPSESNPGDTASETLSFPLTVES